MKKKPKRFDDYSRDLAVSQTANVSADLAADIENQNELLGALKEADVAVQNASNISADDLDSMSGEEFEARRSEVSQAVISGRLTVKRSHSAKVALIERIIEELEVVLEEADRNRVAAEKEAQEIAKMLGFTREYCPFPKGPPTRNANAIRFGHFIRAVPKVVDATNCRHNISVEVNAFKAALRRTQESEAVIDKSLVALCQSHI